MNIATRLGSVAIVLGVSIGLTGCLQSAAPTAHPSRSASRSATPTASPTVSATPSAPATTSPTKFSENCSILLTAAQVYAYNPNFVADGAYAPKAGTVAARIHSAEGQTCGWVNETSGVELEIGVATPGSSGFAAAKAAAASGTPISASGEQGYFTVSNGIGSAQFFIGTLWLIVSSGDFGAASDASTLSAVVVHNQLAAGG